MALNSLAVKPAGDEGDIFARLGLPDPTSPSIAAPPAIAPVAAVPSIALVPNPVQQGDLPAPQLAAPPAVQPTPVAPLARALAKVPAIQPIAKTPADEPTQGPDIFDRLGLERPAHVKAEPEDIFSR